MRLLVVGLSHRTAPIELRECVDFTRGGLDAALKALAVRGICQETVVLSTCNRAEVYAVTETRRRRLSASHGSSASITSSITARPPTHLYTRSGGDAARHLFRVAAGLDSLVVGEPQILGQVKAAYTDRQRPAVHRPAAQPAVPLVVRSRQARPQRDRARRRRGVGQLRGDRAGQEDLRQAVRSGRADSRRRRDGELTASHLNAQQVRHITIASRTLASAERLAGELGATAAAWTAVDDVLWHGATSWSPPPARPNRC